MLCVQRWLPYKTHIQASRHWRYPLEGLLWKWLSLSWQQQQQNMMLLVVIISIFFSAAAAVANEDKWAATSEIRQRYQSVDANSSGGSWKSLSHSHSLSTLDDQLTFERVSEEQKTVTLFKVSRFVLSSADHHHHRLIIAWRRSGLLPVTYISSNQRRLFLMMIVSAKCYVSIVDLKMYHYLLLSTTEWQKG